MRQPTAPPTAPRRRAERGAGAVEYAVLAAAVAGVLVIALTGLAHVLSSRIDCVTTVVQGSGHNSSGASGCDAPQSGGGPGAGGTGDGGPGGGPTPGPGPTSGPTPTDLPTPTPTSTSTSTPPPTDTTTEPPSGSP